MLHNVTCNIMLHVVFWHEQQRIEINEMINPRTLLATLNESAQLLLRITSMYGLEPFSAEEFVKRIGKHGVELKIDQSRNLFEKFLRHEIIEALPRSDMLIIKPIVHDFLSSLQNEFEIGPSGEIKTFAEGIRRIMQRLNTAVEERNDYEITRHCRALASFIRKISQSFYRNMIAIETLASGIKSQEQQHPLKILFRQVLEAYSDYVTPMLEMTDINGVISETLGDAEAQLDDYFRLLISLGGFKEQAYLIRLRKLAIIDVRAIGRESLLKSKNILTPLKNDLRVATMLSSRAAELLAFARKPGHKSYPAEVLPRLQASFRSTQIPNFNSLVQAASILQEYEDKPILATENENRSHRTKLRMQDQAYEMQLNAIQTPCDAMVFLSEQFEELPPGEIVTIVNKAVRTGAVTGTKTARKTLHFGKHNLTASLRSYTVGDKSEN